MILVIWVGVPYQVGFHIRLIHIYIYNNTIKKKVPIQYQIFIPFVNNYTKRNCIHNVNSVNEIIAQTEHPILKKPFHMLHPCRTKATLNNFDCSFMLE